MDDAPHDGLIYKSKGTEIDASQSAIHEAADAFNQLLQHPIICFGILILIGFIIWDWNRTRLKREHLKEEYGTRRFMAQQQYSLPLIEPDKPALPQPGEHKK